MRVFLDLDGVVVDFVQGLIDWFNLDFKHEDCQNYEDIYKFYPGTKADLWESLPDRFWAELNFTKEAVEILTFLEPLKPCILTSPVWTGAGGKQQWIRKNLPNYFDEKRYLIGPAKDYAAHKGSLLIDDAEDMVEKFQNAEGYTILVPRPWNYLRGKDVLTHIKNSLYTILLYHQYDLQSGYILKQVVTPTWHSGVERTFEWVKV